MTRRILSALVVLLLLLMAVRTDAAIQGGSKATNAAVAEQDRIAQFDAATLSDLDKLRVGRERYQQKQITRAKVVASMTAQLHAHERTVLGPPPTANFGEDAAAESPYQPSLAQVLLATVVIGYGFYLRRLRLETAVVRRDPKKSALHGARSFRPRYKVTALRPVVIWANVEVAASERTLLRGTVKRTKDVPVWVQLQSGETRDHLGSVIGIHPQCVPTGKRIHLTVPDEDIVPLGAWSDGDLPRDFYEYFKLEVSH